jgi:multidrug efflux pump subunit AcrA (membrane-fusion protein)
VDAYPDKTFEGVIENIAPQISGTSRTSTAKVRIENPEGFLMPGMFARVRIMLYSKKDALVVPTDAIQGSEGEKFVYAIKMSGGSVPNPVEPKVAGATKEELGAMAMVNAGAKGQGKVEKKSGKETGKAPGEKDSAKIEEGTVEKRPVTVGYTRTDYSQIDAGLAEGEIVVMTGFERLEDGKKIRLIETQEAEL